ncbi:phosphoribosyl transferase [Candidatus Parcubacteria bacterium]|jgi:predicted phosphoribosyltransferase|nr:MAG: phosphoribosyl transferase [Candidatus Parcubacteria bacterium]
MHFLDRRDAGERLARALLGRIDTNERAVVVALPRGGVAVGAPIARHLQLPLRVMLVRKVGMPGNPEAAVCAVAENGIVVCDEDARERVPPEWLENAVELSQHEIEERTRRFQPWMLSEDASRQTAIVVDDGAATGLTILAAIAALREKGAKRVVVGLPVAPLEVGHLLRQQADEVIIFHEDTNFMGAVGAYYEHFNQLSDEETLALLESANTRTLS